MCIIGGRSALVLAKSSALFSVSAGIAKTLGCGKTNTCEGHNPLRCTEILGDRTTKVDEKKGESSTWIDTWVE